jgi:hypothetical protein
VLINNIQTVFNTNINPFMVKMSSNLALIDLNKQFLKQVILAVHKLIPSLAQEQHFKKINITNEEVTEAYKIEDIHTERQTEFEKQLKLKQNELESYMTLTKPQLISFSDNMEENKIVEMDSLIAEKLAQRDSELEILYQNNLKTADTKNNWLTAQETSLKSERVSAPNTTVIDTETRFKYLKVDEISVNTNSPKKVTWGDDNNNNEESLSIFQKLKKTNAQDNKYAQQSSMTLKDIAPITMTVSEVQPTITSPNPIIPSTELVKQLNDMNTKLEQLFGIVNKLTETVSSIATTKQPE